MPEKREATEILKSAREALDSDEFGGFTLPKSRRVDQTIPVLTPDGALHSWFVPVTVGELLAGFFEFDPNGALMRYSSFQRQESSLQGCPAAESWTDAATVQRQAAAKARTGEKAGEAFLTYDRAPARLCWQVSLESPDGTVRAVHVAGNVVWDAPGDDAETFGSGPSH